MKHLKILLICLLTVMLQLLPACDLPGGFFGDAGSAQAATYYESLEVGDTKYLYTKATGKAVLGAAWTSSDPYNVQILSQDSVSCRIKVAGYTSSRVIVHCEYYYQQLVGNYMYTFTDFTDYYIDIKPSNVTITLNANGGSVSSSTVIRQIGETYNTLPTPTRTGYSFDGWYTSSGKRVTASTALVSNSNHTLYAEWSPNSYAIRFDGNGADGGSMANMNCLYGSSYNLSANQFTRSGYIFSGWCTSSSGSGTIYADGASVRNLTGSGSVTLYAVWATGSHNLADYSVSLAYTSTAYDGSAKTPAATVKSGAKTLSPNTDYIVSYRDNLYPGTATAVIQGVGEYGGAVEKTFAITKGNASASISSRTLIPGETAKITVSSSAGAYYTGYDSDILYVSADGVITALKPGTTTVKINANADYYYNEGVCSVSITVSAPKSGKCGKSVQWALDSTGKKLTISGTGDMYDFGTYSEQPWYDSADKITSVVVENGVRYTGKYSFAGFDALKSITLADSVEEIGERSFKNAAVLTSMTLGSGLETIGYRAFCGCRALTSITLGNSVKTIEREAFILCENLKSISLGSGIEYIGYRAFDMTYRSSYKSYYNNNRMILNGWLVGVWDRAEAVVIDSSVKYIADGALDTCKNVTLSSSNKNFVWTHNGKALSTADKTRIIWTNADFDTVNLVLPEGMKHIDAYAFVNCKTIKTVTIPSTVESIGEHAFSGCTSLQQIILPEGVRYIGDSAFANCSAMTRISLPASLVQMGVSPFYNCTALSSVQLASGNTSYKLMDGVLFNKAGDTLICYPGGLTRESYSVPRGVHTIGEYAVSYASKLKNVILPEGIQLIASNAFYCTPLNTIDLPLSLIKVDTFAFYSTSPKTVRYAGSESQKANIKISAFNDPLKNAEWTCIGTSSSLDDMKDILTIPAGTVTIDMEAFAGVGAQVIKVPEGCMVIGNRAFADCPNLRFVLVPSGIKHIAKDAISGSNAQIVYQ